MLLSNIGKDATTAFLGGVYEHSHAAHNVRFAHSFNPTRPEILMWSWIQLLAMMRVGVLLGGLEHVSEIYIPPAQRLRVVGFGEEI